MNQRIDSTFPTAFQQIFAFFCVLMTEICILLFSSILASKLSQLLITPNPLSLISFPCEAGEGQGWGIEFSNRITQKISFYGAIATQKFCHAQKIITKITILSHHYKLCESLSFKVSQSKRFPRLKGYIML
jgi:hypothetical protein